MPQTTGRRDRPARPPVGFAIAALIAAGLIVIVGIIFRRAAEQAASGSVGAPAPSAAGGGTGPYGAPTNFRAVDHGAVVDLSWTDNSLGTADYVLSYATPAGPPTTTDLGRGVTSYEVLHLDPAQGYCFTLGAVLRNDRNQREELSATTSVRGCRPGAPGPTGSP